MDLLDPKSGLFEPYSFYPPMKTSFLAHFVAKSGRFDRLCVMHPLHRIPWLWGRVMSYDSLFELIISECLQMILVSKPKDSIFVVLAKR